MECPAAWQQEGPTPSSWALPRAVAQARSKQESSSKERARSLLEVTGS